MAPLYADDAPEAGVYYPAMVAHLRIRFDETLVRKVGTAELDPVIVDQLVQSGLDPLGARTTMPLFPGEVVDDGLSHVVDIVPITGSAERAGSRQAGQFALTFSFRDLPIDPRLVRACSVYIHAGTVSASQFADAQSNPGARAGRISSLGANGLPDQRTVRMPGIVDTWEVRHGDNGSTVDIAGRGLAAVFLDSPAPPDLLQKLDLRKEIWEVVQDVIRMHPQAAQFKDRVVRAPRSWWPGGVIPSPASVTPRHRRGTSGEKQPLLGGKGGGSMNYWDIITRYCALVGAVPRFKGSYLMIVPAQSLFQLDKPDAIGPFAERKPRAMPDGSTSSVRQLVYGRNIDTLVVSRKFSGQVARVVEAISLDTTGNRKGKDRYLTARWPVDGKVRGKKVASKVDADGGGSTQEVLRVPVPGVLDYAQLEAAARSIFEEVMRSELTGSVATRAIASTGGSNADTDMLSLDAGDPIRLGVDLTSLGNRPPVAHELVDQTRQPYEAAVAALKARIGDERLARVLVASARGLVQGTMDTFYVEHVRLRWDVQSGLGVEADFRNYVQARLDAVTDEDRQRAQDRATIYPTGTTPLVPIAVVP